MNNNTTVVGLDVHKESITMAVLAAKEDHVREKMRIENNPAAIEKMMQRLATGNAVEFVYEAGPCGYDVHRQIVTMGHHCVVVAPALTPVRPGDRVKTDKRDAAKLARFYRAGELTQIRVPTRKEESARDLVRAREDILIDRQRTRHRLGNFLLRQGRVYHGTTWSLKHWAWVKSQRFDWETLQQSFQAYVRAVQEAQARLEVLDQQLQDLAQTEVYQEPVRYLRCLKGIDTLSALTLVVEVQEFRRFGNARSFMSYTGAVASEYSSGNSIRRGSITKAGNAHIRRILVEAAWNYRCGGVTSQALIQRRKGCPEEILQIARKAQDRLHRKFARMVSRGKLHQVAVVAVARELAGFVWAIACRFPTS